MGRLIDANFVYIAIQITTDDFGVAKHVVETSMLDMLARIPTVEAIPKDQYEARLKADMVAMLEDLDLQIDELSYKQRPFTWDDTGEKGMMDIKPSINDVRSLIQERINALRGEKDNGK